MASGSVKMGKDLAEVFGKGVKENRLNRQEILVGAIPFASTLRAAHGGPIGRLVAGSLEASGIHEGLQQRERVMVGPWPIGGEGSGHFPEQMRGQMGNLNPRKDKESGVLGDEVDIVVSVQGFPSDEEIPAHHLPGCGPPTDAGQGAILIEGDILEVFPHRLAVAQVVVSLNESFVEGLPGRAADHPDFDGAQLLQRSRDGRLAEKRHLDRGGASGAIPMSVLSGGELNQPCPFQAQEQFAASHGFRQTVFLLPLPEAAEFLGDIFPAPGSMRFDKGANDGKVIVRDPSAPDNKRSIHGRLYSIMLLGTPAFS
jgi:hypothetical protein